MEISELHAKLYLPIVNFPIVPIVAIVLKTLFLTLN